MLLTNSHLNVCWLELRKIVLHLPSNDVVKHSLKYLVENKTKTKESLRMQPVKPFTATVINLPGISLKTFRFFDKTASSTLRLSSLVVKSVF